MCFFEAPAQDVEGLLGDREISALKSNSNSAVSINEDSDLKALRKHTVLSKSHQNNIEKHKNIKQTSRYWGLPNCLANRLKSNMFFFRLKSNMITTNRASL